VSVSALIDGIVTIADGDPAVESCDSALRVGARPSAVFGGDVAAREEATLSDDKVVMVQCVVIFGD
jgi:hypothetical protein